MLRARTAGTAPALDSAGRSAPRSRRGGGFSRRSAVVVGGLRRIVHLIVSVVVLIIVAGIVLVLFKANATNSIVSDVHDAARWLAGPFEGIFSFHSARVALAVNWGAAAVVYLIVGVLIARLLRPRWLDPSGVQHQPREELS
jgi:hypothetical protein